MKTKSDFMASLAGQLDGWIGSWQEKDIKPHSRLSRDLQGAISHDPTFRSNPAMLRHLAASLPQNARVLDFGCGDLPSKHLFDKLGFDWIGLDYASSIDPAYHKGRRLPADKIVYYDGADIPFGDGEFDLVWSTQALEHVQDPEAAFAEIARVTRAGGCLAGSVSFLEPYHARSTYSYTPYGFRLLAERHGFALRTISPGVDGLTLMLKRLCGIAGDPFDWGDVFRQGGLLTPLIERKLLGAGHGETDVAEMLLQICGHFRFILSKMPKEEPAPSGLHSPP